MDLNHAFELSRVSRRHAGGFTLIEVLIAIVILAFISLGLYNAITETYRVRETLSTEGDFHNGIRLSMNILQRDLTLLYSPIGLLPSPAPSPSTAAQLQQAQTQAAQINATGSGSCPDLRLLGAGGRRPTAFVLRVSPEPRTNSLSSPTPICAFTRIRPNPNSPTSPTNSRATTRIRTLQMLVKTENTDAFNIDKRNHRALSSEDTRSFTESRRSSTAITARTRTNGFPTGTPTRMSSKSMVSPLPRHRRTDHSGHERAEAELRRKISFQTGAATACNQPEHVIQKNR